MSLAFIAYTRPQQNDSGEFPDTRNRKIWLEGRLKIKIACVKYYDGWIADI